MVFDSRQERVSTAGNQADEWRFKRLQSDEVSRHMTLEVIDCNERQTARRSYRFRLRYAHQQGPNQPGSLRHGDAIEIRKSDLRLGERRFDRGSQQLKVLTSSDLRNHTAVAIVDSLRRDDV